MIPTQLRITKAVALILVFSLLQIGALASAAQDTPPSPPQAVGRLSTTGNRDIQVDKNDASTGATILDGMTLETPDCTAATVRIGPVDMVHLATNTIAVINYSAGKVKVTLKQGCVKLLVGEGIEGTIETPDGKIITASKLDTLSKLAEACYQDGGKSIFDPSCIPLGFIIWGTTAGVGGTLAVVAVVAAAGGDNPSDMAPSF